MGGQRWGAMQKKLKVFYGTVWTKGHIFGNQPFSISWGGGGGGGGAAFHVKKTHTSIWGENTQKVKKLKVLYGTVQTNGHILSNQLFTTSQ